MAICGLGDLDVKLLAAALHLEATTSPGLPSAAARAKMPAMKRVSMKNRYLIAAGALIVFAAWLGVCLIFAK